MEDAKFIAIIIGIIGALIGVYFRETIRKAQSRLLAAITLESTLFYWFNLGMKDKNAREFLITGYAYGKKETEAVQTKDINKIDEFRQKLEEGFTKAKKNFTKEQEANIDEMLKKIKNLSREEYNEILRDIEDYRISIKDGTGFLDQEKIIVLDWYMLPKILETKSEIQSILLELRLVLIHTYTNENPDKEKIVSSMFSMMGSALNITKNLMPLIQYSKKVREKGLLGNVFSKNWV